MFSQLFVCLFLNQQKVWADEVEEWEHCADNDLPCAALYVPLYIIIY